MTPSRRRRGRRRLRTVHGHPHGRAHRRHSPGACSPRAISRTPGEAPRQFRECYGPTWGRFLDRTSPAIGNHEYETPDARGYFGYFGSRAGKSGEWLVRLRPRDVARLRPELQLRPRRLRAEVEAGPVAAPQPRETPSRRAWPRSGTTPCSRPATTATTRWCARCGRRSRTRTRTWSSMATTTITSGLRPRRRRGGRGDQDPRVRRRHRRCRAPAVPPSHGEQRRSQRVDARRPGADPVRGRVRLALRAGRRRGVDRYRLRDLPLTDPRPLAADSAARCRTSTVTARSPSRPCRAAAPGLPLTERAGVSFAFSQARAGRLPLEESLDAPKRPRRAAAGDLDRRQGVDDPEARAATRTRRPSRAPR